MLRGGPRLPIEDLPSCDYYAMVSRVEKRPSVNLWPIQLRDQLPTIPIPLRAPEADAHLNLQELLHHVYDAASYVDYLYLNLPRPPLDAEDADWARRLLPS